MGGRIERAGKNVVISIITQLLMWCFTFVVTLFLPRYVGSKGLGEMAVASAFISVFGVVATLGTSAIIVKDVARNPGRTPEILASGLMLRFPLAAVFGMGACGLSFLLGYTGIVRELILVFAVAMIVTNLNDTLAAVLQGQENTKRMSVAALTEKIVFASITILLIFCHASLQAIAAVSIISGAIALIVNLSAFRDYYRDLRLPNSAAILGLASAGLPIVGWSILRTLYGQTDPLVLNYVTNVTVIGWYAAATRLVGTMMFFPAAMTSTLMPTLAALFADGSTDEFKSLARRLVTLMFLIGVPAAVILICLPQEMLSLLHYPPSFNGTIPVLRIAGAGLVLYFAAMAFGTVIIAADKQGKMFVSSIIATVVGIPACIVGSVIAGRLWGNAAAGAMASDALLEAILIVAYLRAAPPGTFEISTFFVCIRIIGASLPMVFTLLSPLGHRLGLWAIAPALCCYAVGCILLRCVDAEYWRFANRLVRRRSAQQS